MGAPGVHQALGNMGRVDPNMGALWLPSVTKITFIGNLEVTNLTTGGEPARDLNQLMMNFGNHKGIWVTHVPYGYIFVAIRESGGTWGCPVFQPVGTCLIFPKRWEIWGNLKKKLFNRFCWKFAHVIQWAKLKMPINWTSRVILEN